MKETWKEKLQRKIREIFGNEQGVTLIELLAVVVILAIIAAVAVPAVMGNMTTAKSNTDKQSEAIIQDAINRLFVSNSEQTFTITNGNLDSGTGSSVATITIGGNTAVGLGDVLKGTTTSIGSITINGGPFLNDIPTAKSNSSGKFTIPTDTSPTVPTVTTN